MDIVFQGKLCWSGLIAQGFFCFASYILLYLPVNVSGHDFATFQDYYEIFNNLPRIYISSAISIIIAISLNAYLIVRWKILLHGKYFFLRSFCSSTIGEGIFYITGHLYDRYRQR